MTIPTGSTEDSDRQNVFWYPRGERHGVKFVVAPDKRDAELERLTTALRHIRALAHDAEALVSVGMDNVVSAILLLACDALDGEAQPSATVEEELAI